MIVVKKHKNGSSSVIELDDEDFSRIVLEGWKFRIYHPNSRKEACLYREIGELREDCNLARYILGLEVGSLIQADHIDRNPLNCKRDNLRKANTKEQSINVVRRRKAEYGIRVVKDKRYSDVYVAKDLGGSNLGAYKSKEDAQLVADKEVLKHPESFINGKLIEGITNFSYEYIVNSPEPEVRKYKQRSRGNKR